VKTDYYLFQISEAHFQNQLPSKHRIYSFDQIYLNEEHFWPFKLNVVILYLQVNPLKSSHLLKPQKVSFFLDHSM
jgi:hypothetical protein